MTLKRWYARVWILQSKARKFAVTIGSVCLQPVSHVTHSHIHTLIRKLKHRLISLAISMPTIFLGADLIPISGSACWNVSWITITFVCWITVLRCLFVVRNSPAVSISLLVILTSLAGWRGIFIRKQWEVTIFQFWFRIFNWRRNDFSDGHQKQTRICFVTWTHPLLWV